MKRFGQIITNCEVSQNSVLKKDEFLQVEMRNRARFFKSALASGLSSQFIGECTDLSSSEVEQIASQEVV